MNIQTPEIWWSGAWFLLWLYISLRVGSLEQIAGNLTGLAIFYVLASVILTAWARWRRRAVRGDPVSGRTA